MKPAEFGVDPRQLAAQINKTIPIRLTRIDALIERIAEQHTSIDRTTIAIVVRKFFEILRSEILCGHVINLEKNFSGMVLMTYLRRSKTGAISQVKVKVKTPHAMRK